MCGIHISILEKYWHMSNTVWESTKRSVVFNIAIVFLAIFLGVNAVQVLWQAFDVREESVKEQDKIGKLRAQKEQLEAQLRELETKEALEREAKSRLNLKLPGEEVVVVVSEKKEKPTEAPHSPGFWKRIKEKLTFWQ